MIALTVFATLKVIRLFFPFSRLFQIYFYLRLEFVHLRLNRYAPSVIHNKPDEALFILRLKGPSVFNNN